jgi:transcriptional regulator with XRE-family HTH domain
MEDIGRRLRESREKLGLTLEEVERHTRIRIHHLEALERGDFAALASSVQARGFLRNYADFLGLESDQLLLRYAETLQARRSRGVDLSAITRPTRPPGGDLRPVRRRLLSPDMLVGVAISLGILAVLGWGASRVLAAMRERSEQVQLASGFLIPTFEPSATVSPLPLPVQAASEVFGSASTPTAILPLPAGSPVNLRLAADGWAWVRVLVDGSERFQGRVLPGQTLDYGGDSVIEVATGNGAAFRVFFNGEDQGPLGDVGEVVIRLWTRAGPITPTPTVTPTGTPTVRPTSTLRPSSTPRP